MRDFSPQRLSPTLPPTTPGFLSSFILITSAGLCLIFLSSKPGPPLPSQHQMPLLERLCFGMLAGISAEQAPPCCPNQVVATPISIRANSAQGTRLGPSPALWVLQDYYPPTIGHTVRGQQKR